MEQKDLAAAMKKLEEMDKEAERKTLQVENLSLIEHIMIGSSYTVDGEVWGTDKVLDVLNGGDYGKLEKITTPINVLEKQKSIAEVNEGRVGKSLTGSIPIFNFQQSKEDKYIHTYISLGEINQGGQISGEWRVGMVGPDNVEQDSSELQISPDFAKYFTLENAPDGKGSILKFNPIPVQAL